eukprot:3029609-Karenia_brevis.AAC.1
MRGCAYSIASRYVYHANTCHFARHVHHDTTWIAQMPETMATSVVGPSFHGQVWTLGQHGFAPNHGHT